MTATDLDRKQTLKRSCIAEVGDHLRSLVQFKLRYCLRIEAIDIMEVPYEAHSFECSFREASLRIRVLLQGAYLRSPSIISRKCLGAARFGGCLLRLIARWRRGPVPSIVALLSISNIKCATQHESEALMRTLCYLLGQLLAKLDKQGLNAR